MAERLRNSYDFRFHLHEAQTGAAVEFKSSEPRGHPRRAVYGGYGRRTACRLDALFGVRVGRLAIRRGAPALLHHLFC